MSEAKEAPILCIASSFNRSSTMSEVVPHDMFPVRYLTSDTPEVDFKEAKESKKPIVLFILGPNGHHALRYLCDDYELPPSERRVRWVHSLSAGIDWYNLGPIMDYVKDTTFTNGKGAYSYMLGLHAVYSILYFNRQTAKMQQLRREHQFGNFFLDEIRGSKVGILGYGDIGREAARMLQPMGVEVTGVRRSIATPVRDEYDVLQVAGDAATQQVIEESDYLINLLPKTAGTVGMFNSALFARMKRTAVYINLGRGETQKDGDLAAALRDGVIAGASLDVFEVEPLPPSYPLFDVPDDKLLLTPHNACMTTESFKGAIKRFVELAKQFLETGALEGVYKPHLQEGY